ncbi:hypothetical protein A3C86_01180 [Candidatus Kaiserbacteria bacterium RIFCSPHIGHO2_02_FULL_49_16]|uniref:Uncharacterized protein n=1 Tax=Candidatus Kaiserbacteria bacterium RIFCSPHIGHO2_02_FULL_49_16 TaxID=1798490 RepID=A0A1F6DGC0_9BACT|nr:MAG: hypothetical protein A3C86_01180 [Candidatus Kaiserbacteria bacterium RIFCSPHIGHO2_02_FULL_49_16]
MVKEEGRGNRVRPLVSHPRSPKQVVAELEANRALALKQRSLRIALNSELERRVMDTNSNKIITKYGSSPALRLKLADRRAITGKVSALDEDLFKVKLLNWREENSEENPELLLDLALQWNELRGRKNSAPTEG